MERCIQFRCWSELLLFWNFLSTFCWCIFDLLCPLWASLNILVFKILFHPFLSCIFIQINVFDLPLSVGNSHTHCDLILTIVTEITFVIYRKQSLGFEQDLTTKKQILFLKKVFRNTWKSVKAWMDIWWNILQPCCVMVRTTAQYLPTLNFSKRLMDWP